VEGKHTQTNPPSSLSQGGGKYSKEIGITAEEIVPKGGSELHRKKPESKRHKQYTIK